MRQGAQDGRPLGSHSNESKCQQLRHPFSPLRPTLSQQHQRPLMSFLGVSPAIALPLPFPACISLHTCLLHSHVRFGTRLHHRRSIKPHLLPPCAIQHQNSCIRIIKGLKIHLGLCGGTPLKAPPLSSSAPPYAPPPTFLMNPSRRSSCMPSNRFRSFSFASLAAEMIRDFDSRSVCSGRNT